MDDIIKFLVHIISPSSKDVHNSDTYKKVQNQITESVKSLNVNLNEMDFVFKKINAQIHTSSIYKNDFSETDTQSTLKVINQIFDSFKPLLQVAKNQPLNEVDSQNEFHNLYWNFIKSTVKCLQKLALPEYIYLQTYASLAPLLCIYLMKTDKELHGISASDFKILVRSYEEYVEAVLHFLSDTKLESFIEKFLYQFSKIKPSSEKNSQYLGNDQSVTYNQLLESLDLLKSILIPKPQKSEHYKAALRQLGDLRYKLLSFFDGTTSMEAVSIFSLLTQLEGILESLKFAYASKESLKSLYKFISKNDYSIGAKINAKPSKKFSECVKRLYIQEIRTLYKYNSNLDNSFLENIEKYLKSSEDYHDFLQTIPSYFELSVIDDMQRSFSDFDITINQLCNFNDCFSMYIEFSRESDDFHKGSALHHNLMKNIIFAEAEVILTILNKETVEPFKDNEDPILKVAEELVFMFSHITYQDEESRLMFKYLTHILQIFSLAVKLMQDKTEALQELKNIMKSNMPSFAFLDQKLNIQNEIKKLVGLINSYSELQDAYRNDNTAKNYSSNNNMEKTHNEDDNTINQVTNESEKNEESKENEDLKEDKNHEEMQHNENNIEEIKESQSNEKSKEDLNHEGETDGNNGNNKDNISNNENSKEVDNKDDNIEEQINENDKQENAENSTIENQNDDLRDGQDDSKEIHYNHEDFSKENQDENDNDSKQNQNDNDSNSKENQDDNDSDYKENQNDHDSESKESQKDQKAESKQNQDSNIQIEEEEENASNEKKNQIENKNSESSNEISSLKEEEEESMEAKVNEFHENKTESKTTINSESSFEKKVPNNNYRKLFQLSEMILREIDIISPYKLFPSLYSEFIEMIGGSSDKTFKAGSFDHQAFEISIALLSMFDFEFCHFSYSLDFFIEWIEFAFSIIQDASSNQYSSNEKNFADAIPFCDFSFILPCASFTFIISKNILNHPMASKETHKIGNEINNKEIFIAIEKLRTFTSTALKTFNVDENQFSQLLNETFTTMKQTLPVYTYSRLKNQLSCIDSIITFILQINKFCSLLKQKYRTNFNPTYLAYYNYIISTFQLLHAVKRSSCLDESFQNKLFDILENFFESFTVKRPKFFSSKESLLNFVSDTITLFAQLKQLINKFDVIPLVESAYQYVNSVFNYFDRSNILFTQDTLISALYLDLQAEGLIHKKAIFQRCYSVSALLYVLLNIKQHPPKLNELYEKLRETAVTAFIIYNLHSILVFVQHVFLEIFEINILYTFPKQQPTSLFDDDFDCDDMNIFSDIFFNNDYGSITSYENKRKDIIDPRFLQVNEAIYSVIDEAYDIRSHAQKLLKIFEEDLKNNSENQTFDPKDVESFQDLCSVFFNNINDASLPFLKANEELQQIRSECQNLINELKSENEKCIVRTNETEKSFVKARDYFHLTRMKIENAILNDKIMRIDIQQKHKQLAQIKAQIEEKSRELALKNEKTQPEMKIKQKEQFLHTIHALRELLEPTKCDNNEIAVLTKKLNELNAQNDEIRQQLHEIEIKHSTTQEDEIELLLINENNSIYSKSNQEDEEQENEALKQQIAETEASISRIKKQLKATNEMINEDDSNILKFLSTIRSRNISDAPVDYESFKDFQNQTMERIQRLITTRQELIDEMNNISST